MGPDKFKDESRYYTLIPARGHIYLNVAVGLAYPSGLKGYISWNITLDRSIPGRLESRDQIKF